jgi:pilus assembly protein CpaB
MKAARIVVLGVALAAGGLAALLAGGSEPPPPAAPAPVVNIDTVEILVAKADVAMGQSVTPNEMQWQIWPTQAASPAFIRRSDRPDAIEAYTGSIARSPFVAGEPLRDAKLIKANGSGFMAALLPSGKRAISTEISPETGAGGFILPNDHVDVILSRRDGDKDSTSGGHISETILTNIRVLAIDQTLGEKDGQKVVIGKTATLELTPRQAENLALSRQQGTLSLSLRSLADAQGNTLAEGDDPKSGRRINVVRYGVTTSVAPK